MPIHGDLSPKNIVRVTDPSGFRFYDLESAHQGNIEFDLGFLAGHLLIHVLHGRHSSELVDEFVKAYDERAVIKADPIALRGVVAATMLYRLDNSVVPYDCGGIFPETRATVVNCNKRYLSQLGLFKNFRTYAELLG